MRLPVLLLALFAVFVAFAPENADARGFRYTFPDMRPEEKVLGSSDEIPNWTQEDVKIFCAGRKKTVLQNEKSCAQSHKDDIGHPMTLGDLQELNNFKAGMEKPKKQGKAAPRSKDKNGQTIPQSKPRVDSTIVQPPLPD